METRLNEIQQERRLHLASIGQQKAAPKGVDGTLEDASYMGMDNETS